MANITLVIGGARSGKSSYASRLALSACDTPVYVATARRFEGDTAWDERIALHKKDRGPPWVDVEEQKALSAHAATFRGKVVVIDCCTLWLTNFFLDADNDGKKALEAVKAEFDKMIQQWDTSFILVSNELGSGTHAETSMGRAFVDAQGWLNQHVAAAAQRVVLMVAGQPMFVKEPPTNSPGGAGRSATLQREAEATDAVLSTRHLEMDGKGYLIIRLQPSEAMPIVAEYHSCATNDKGEVVDPVTGEVIPCCGGEARPPARVLRGRTAKELQVRLFEGPDGEGLVSSHQHACYVGRELQKAEECLAAGRRYQMD
uniref:Adenosylcobinamide kinase n=1 Tax=Phaeocystis antarctica TaxID=33657 RepID=A0A7S0HQK2_9EUKA